MKFTFEEKQQIYAEHGHTLINVVAQIHTFRCGNCFNINSHSAMRKDKIGSTCSKCKDKMFEEKKKLFSDNGLTLLESNSSGYKYQCSKCLTTIEKKYGRIVTGLLPPKICTKCKIFEIYASFGHNLIEITDTGYRLFECGNCSKLITHKIKLYRLKSRHCKYCEFESRPIEKQNAMREKVSATKLNQSKAEKDKINERKKETCNKKYQCDYVFQLDKVKEKTKETCIRKYGVDHPQKSDQIRAKCVKNCYKSKQFIFPSGRIDYVQGYEPFALIEALKKYNENDIITQPKGIQYFNEEKNKECIYFPDIYIKSTDTYFEIKSPWTFAKNFEENICKLEAVTNQEKNIECCIYDKCKKNGYRLVEIITKESHFQPQIDEIIKYVEKFNLKLF